MSAASFRVKNFESFQHYKDRSPPWIKLYNELLDNYEFGRLPDASKAHLVAIWLLASRSDNKLPLDPEWVAKRINATEHVDLDGLADAGFIIVDQQLQTVEREASTPLATCLPRERDRAEEETDTSSLRSDVGRGKRASLSQDLAEFKTELAALDTERLEAIVKLRRAKKGQLTGHAARLFIVDARSCDLSLADAVDTCISRNWITVRPDWLARKNGTGPPSMNGSHKSPSAAQAAVDALESLKSNPRHTGLWADREAGKTIDSGVVRRIG